MLPAAILSAQKPQADKERIDPIVYVTKTGEKYHNGPCRYLRQSKIAMKLSEAAKRFSPCSVCKPPSAKSSRTASQRHFELVGEWPDVTYP